MPHPLPNNPRTTPTPPRGEVATPASSFEAACKQRDFTSLQAAVRGMTAKDAKSHLCDLFPHRSTDWMRRNFVRLMALDPGDFERSLHSDPTGDKAARNVDDQRARQSERAAA